MKMQRPTGTRAERMLHVVAVACFLFGIAAVAFGQSDPPPQPEQWSAGTSLTQDGDYVHAVLNVTRGSTPKACRTLVLLYNERARGMPLFSGSFMTNDSWGSAVGTQHFQSHLRPMDRGGDHVCAEFMVVQPYEPRELAEAIGGEMRLLHWEEIVLAPDRADIPRSSGETQWQLHVPPLPQSPTAGQHVRLYWWSPEKIERVILRGAYRYPDGTYVTGPVLWDEHTPECPAEVVLDDDMAEQVADWPYLMIRLVKDTGGTWSAMWPIQQQ